MASACQIPPGPPFSKGGAVICRLFKEGSSYLSVWVRRSRVEHLQMKVKCSDHVLYMEHMIVKFYSSTFYDLRLMVSQ